DQHFAFGNFVADAIARRSIVVRGDGTPRRSYLYASDLARWLWALLARGVSGRAYNVGSDVAVSIAELAREVGRIGGVGVEVLGTPTPGVAPPRYVPAIDRARSELGLDVHVDLATAIQKTLAWNQP
ncbi:MAG: NAD-dependent epimerase/dehydratase family protein, partial [Polyangiales bacterium]